MGHRLVTAGMASTLEWRGIETLRALRTLRSDGGSDLRSDGELSTHLLQLVVHPLPVGPADAHELDTQYGNRLLPAQTESDLKCIPGLIGVGRLADDREHIRPVLLSLEDAGEHAFTVTQVPAQIDCGGIVRHPTIMAHVSPERELMARPDPIGAAHVLAWVMRLRRQALMLVVVASLLAVTVSSVNAQAGTLSVKSTTQRAYRPVPNPANDPLRVSVSNVRPNPAHAESDEPVVYRNGCHVYTRAGTYAHFCVYGDKNAKTTMVLFGDSHVAQWFSAFDGAARLEHVKLLYITKTSCPAQDVSVRVWERDIPYGACDVWRNHAFTLIKKLKHVDLIVMGGYAHHQVTKRHTNIRLSGRARTKEWEAGTQRTVAALHAVAEHFVILRDTPLMRLKTANCILSTHGDNRACQTATAKATADSLWHAEQRVAAKYDNVGVLDMTSSFCTPSWCRPVTDTRVLRWRDRSHMSLTFSRLLAPRMRWMIRRALAGQLTG